MTVSRLRQIFGVWVVHSGKSQPKFFCCFLNLKEKGMNYSKKLFFSIGLDEAFATQRHRDLYEEKTKGRVISRK